MEISLRLKAVLKWKTWSFVIWIIYRVSFLYCFDNLILKSKPLQNIGINAFVTNSCSFPTYSSSDSKYFKATQFYSSSQVVHHHKFEEKNRQFRVLSLNSLAGNEKEISNKSDEDLNQKNSRSRLTLLNYLTKYFAKDKIQKSQSPDLQWNESETRQLMTLLLSITSACKEISFLIRRSAFDVQQDSANDRNIVGTGINAGGEEQKKLDIIANNILKTSIQNSQACICMCSEEDYTPLVLDPTMVGNKEQRLYTVSFDPLDGSSNIDASIPTGTIFSIHRAKDNVKENPTESLFQKGDDQVAAGYVLYSSSTLLMISFGKGSGTHLFGYDEHNGKGEFVLIKQNVQIPKRGSTYSLNEARAPDWPTSLQEYIKDIKQGKKNQSVSAYDLVYVCSLVSDAHYVFKHGGMACNPRSHLRLLYEAAPIALLVDEAGGYATDGSKLGTRIGEIIPSDVHQRLPFFLGSEDDIKEMLSYGDVRQIGNKTYTDIRV